MSGFMNVAMALRVVEKGVGPTAVELSGDVDSPTQIVLSWSGAEPGTSPLAGYQVQRSVDGGPYTTLDTIDPNDARDYTDTTVDLTSHSYDYRIVTVDENGLTSVSNVVHFEQL